MRMTQWGDVQKFDGEIGHKANFKFFPQEDVFDEQKFRQQVGKALMRGLWR
jgi:hypothetical protein